MYKILRVLYLIVFVTNIPSLLAVRVGNQDYQEADLNDETVSYKKRRIVVDCNRAAPNDLSDMFECAQDVLYDRLLSRIEISNIAGYKTKDLEILFREISTDSAAFSIKANVRTLGYEHGKHENYTDFLLKNPLLNFTCSEDAPQDVKNIVQRMLEEVRGEGLI